MEEPEHQDQQAPKPKTRPGEGYTRRIQGKKKLTSVLLQEQLQATQAKLRELQEQNDLLRMKEALQTRTLEGIELALHQIGTAADAPAPQGGPSTERSAESLLQAVLLDLQALRLKQSLQAVTVPEQGGAGPSTEAQEIIANTFASPEARLAAARAAVSAMSSDSGTSSGLSGGSGGSGACDTPAAGSCSDPNKRMQQVMFSLTPAEVQAAQDLTLQELAGRLRDDVARLAMARKADGESDPAEVEKAVLGYMRTMCLSLVSNDERHCIIIGMNLETMQHEGPPDSMFEEAVKAAKLQPHQLQQLTMAFQTYSDEQAELLQQQQGIMQQLQSLLGAESQSSGGQAPSPPGSPSGQHSAATASAGGAVPAAAASGPAHFMSLATGVAVKRAKGARTQQMQQQACASTGASVPAGSAAAAEATSGAQTRSALLKAKAAAAAAGAAAAGSGGGGGSSAGQGPPLSQAGACQEALGGQPGQGADWGCYQPGAAAGGGSSSGAAPSSSGAGTSNSGAGTSSSAAGSSGWLAPEGLLCLEDADKAEQLLLEWQRVAHRMKRQARSLASMVMNLLACEQLADSLLAGYPFTVPAPKFCAHAIRMAQEQQKALQR